MNAIDKKRAKLYCQAEELQAAHRSRACGRRSCDCLKKYEALRKRYISLIDPENNDKKVVNSRRIGRN